VHDVLLVRGAYGSAATAHDDPDGIARTKEVKFG
jgi:hypothetical protein